MAVLGFTSSAQAAEVDFSQVLKALNGEPLVASKDVQMTTLSDFCTAALMSQMQNEAPAPGGAEKAKRYLLAIRIEREKKFDLDADDTKRIKDTVALAFGPLIVGQVWSIVDPASVK